MSREGPSDSMQNATKNGVAPQGNSTSSPTKDTGTSMNKNAAQRPISALAAFTTRIPEPTVNGLCGAVAGIASGIVTCPLDVIKTRLQAQGSFRRRLGPRLPNAHLYHGLVGTARTIWVQDGIRGMYRGLGPMLLGYLPTWTVYMSVYEQTRGWYHSHLGI
jgi:solute carrier family 25 (mitochondrial folate transporter), member 32